LAREIGMSDRSKNTGNSAAFPNDQAVARKRAPDIRLLMAALTLAPWHGARIKQVQHILIDNRAVHRRRCRDRHSEDRNQNPALRPLTKLRRWAAAGGAAIRPRRRRVMDKQEPPSSMSRTRSLLFFIGKDRRGNWVVQDQQRLCGGLFVNRAEALRFAMFENGRRPQAVVMVPGVFELDLNGKASVVDQPPVHTDARSARSIREGFLSFPPNPTVAPV